MSSTHPIKIAIIGGGLAGATLMNALLKHPHLDVDIYESAPEFSERGAAVGIATNAQAALDEIGEPVSSALDRAGAVVMATSRLCIATGSNALDVLFDLAGEQRGKVVHRAALLSELLRPIDKTRTHTNKKLSRIEELSGGRLRLVFQDGVTSEVDAVIGADGVRGFVREHILGADHPALRAQVSRFKDSRALLPMEEAKAILGAEYFDESHRQYGWIGDGGFFMHDVLDNGKTVQCVLCIDTAEAWGSDAESKDLYRSLLEQALANWTNTPLRRGIVEVGTFYTLKAYAQSHHFVDAPTYAKGHACIMGDAAHCMTPWQGSGAGMAIEDAMILETLLREVTDPAEIPAAFRAYDEVRRPRTQRVVHSSYGTGLILSGRGSDTRLDKDKISQALPPRWGFIYEFDMKEHKRDALTAFEGLS
ncbi:FAD/NAD(P)-binding domain-containing protein [Lophiostoma macrostomum CBS 122681]|uniref:FAD/NAD(P)-binding domain-containing protein n=1 Tax=Lophiostoma macrostomum CBS 122681 TaxID=1314788 RepID=A0A6A6T8E4_9PLEO|nr:FAD/NAD(P)-binding domain-containing protein [Lophiostoma macrostomum CBS 122681]